ncbi:DUF3833 domain-containing protein [Aliidiomarina quisquiliarum]|uniref:DUF3833 domain-containing protein n=1 Tax=Aliidiomarina quisquiliarum TaxID=2938947 RepID=UPI00208E8A84|nr:DUF3833 domain-containing protein [Aliidiomarina quisquiliarum]MCO4320879.1 DUF3833 domain-containing protein [Aliidiomarina quisquiliarum]
MNALSRKVGNTMIALTSWLLLVGCSAQINDYQGNKPVLKLEEFFNGSLVAHGVVQDRKGIVTQRFRVAIQGSWKEGAQGVLHGELYEKFYWDDGREQTRTWLIDKIGENEYQGRAEDVKGVANGVTAGNALYWAYQLEVPWGEGSIAITLDDWMFLLDSQRLMNRTKMTKFGFKVGEITIYMERMNR